MGPAGGRDVSLRDRSWWADEIEHRSTSGKLEMGYVRCGHGLHRLQPFEIGDAVEQPLAATQPYRYQVEHHFVEQAGVEVLAATLAPPTIATSLPRAARSAWS